MKRLKSLYKKRMTNTQTKGEHMKLTIVNIKGMKFEDANGYYMTSKNTYAFKTEKGYYSEDGVFPYVPGGGKKALQMILDGGGFTSYEGIKFILPTN